MSFTHSLVMWKWRLACIAATSVFLSGALQVGGGPLVYGQAAASGPVRLVVRVDQKLRRGLSLLRDGEDGRDETVQLEDQAGGRGDERILSFPCRPGVYVLHSNEGLVSLPIEIDSMACGSERAVSLLPSAVIKGLLLLPGDSGSRPSTVSLSLRRCGIEGKQGELGSFRTPVRVNGTFAVEVPAGCSDIVASAAHYAPVQLPRVALTLGQEHDVGRLVLKRGASILVRLRTPDGKPLAAGSVGIVGAGSCADFIRGFVVDKTANADYEGRSDQSGQVRFTGVPPDIVYVTAVASGRFAFAGPVELAEGRLAVPEPLTPGAGARVMITVAGGAEWIPSGATLQLSASPVVCGHAVPAAAIWGGLTRDDNQGSLDVPFPGRWSVRLLLVGSDRRGAVIGTEEIEVVDGVNAALAFSMDRVGYEGRVTVSGKAYPGKLVLVTGDPGSRVESTADVDDAGRFRVWLQGPGEYDARFRDSEGTMSLTRGKAVFTPGVPTTVRFSVSNAMAGVVVLPDGSPVVGASVRAQPTIDEFKLEAIRLGVPAAVTDEGGHFSFPALESGSWEVVASYGGRTGSQIVAVSEGDSANTLRLVLESTDTVSGVIVDSFGSPVPLARGRYAVETGSDNGIPPAGVFSSDVSGRFTVGVGQYAGRPIQVAVMAPGHPLGVFRILPIGDRPVTIAVPPAGGELRLRLPHAASAADLNLYVLVNEQGGILPVLDAVTIFGAALVQASAATVVELHSLMPGQWRAVVFLDSKSALLFLAGLGAVPNGREIKVVPGGTVELDWRK